MTGAPAVRRAALPALGMPIIPGYPRGVCRDPRSIWGCLLCRDTPSKWGYPLYSGVSAIPGYPLSRAVPHFGLPPLCPEVPSLPGVLAPSRGTRSGHGRARFHLKQFQVKLQFKISPSAGVSRASGAVCPPQTPVIKGPGSLTPREAQLARDGIHCAQTCTREPLSRATAEAREIRKYSK